LEEIEQTQLSTKDAEYLNRLWKEETATAFADAKKYAAEKAEQRKIAAERLKIKERSKPSTPKNPTDLHLRVEELQKELRDCKTTKPPNNNFKQGAPHITEGDSEEEAEAREAEAVDIKELLKKTRQII